MPRHWSGLSPLARGNPSIDSPAFVVMVAQGKRARTSPGHPRKCMQIPVLTSGKDCNRFVNGHAFKFGGRFDSGIRTVN